VKSKPGALGQDALLVTPIERKRSIESCQLSEFSNQESDSKRYSYLLDKRDMNLSIFNQS
jgi:hypothetical protein